MKNIFIGLLISTATLFTQAHAEANLYEFKMNSAWGQQKVILPAPCGGSAELVDSGQEYNLIISGTVCSNFDSKYEHKKLFGEYPNYHITVHIGKWDVGNHPITVSSNAFQESGGGNGSAVTVLVYVSGNSQAPVAGPASCSIVQQYDYALSTFSITVQGNSNTSKMDAFTQLQASCENQVRAQTPNLVNPPVELCATLTYQNSNCRDAN